MFELGAMRPMLLAGVWGGALFGTALAWVMANRAARTHPYTLVAIAPEMRQCAAAEFPAWAAQNGYRPLQTAQGVVYRKGKGLLTSATEITFSPDHLRIIESVNLILFQRRFAIDAPIFLAKPVRARKMKAINRLLASWGMPMLSFKSKTPPPLP